MPNYLTGYTPYSPQTPGGYMSPYQPAVSNGLQQPYQQPQFPQPSNGIVWVQGINGAKEYPVAAGSSVLLMDNTHNRFYIKSTDPTGIQKQLQVFEFKEVTELQNEIKTEEDSSKSSEKLDFDGLKKQVSDLQAMVEMLIDDKTGGTKNG